MNPKKCSLSLSQLTAVQLITLLGLSACNAAAPTRIGAALNPTGQNQAAVPAVQASAQPGAGTLTPEFLKNAFALRVLARQGRSGVEAIDAFSLPAGLKPQDVRLVRANLDGRDLDLKQVALVGDKQGNAVVLMSKDIFRNETEGKATGKSLYDSETFSQLREAARNQLLEQYKDQFNDTAQIQQSQPLALGESVDGTPITRQMLGTLKGSAGTLAQQGIFIDRNLYLVVEPVRGNQPAYLVKFELEAAYLQWLNQKLQAPSGFSTKSALSICTYIPCDANGNITIPNTPDIDIPDFDIPDTDIPDTDIPDSDDSLLDIINLPVTVDPVAPDETDDSDNASDDAVDDFYPLPDNIPDEPAVDPSSSDVAALPPSPAASSSPANDDTPVANAPGDIIIIIEEIEESCEEEIGPDIDNAGPVTPGKKTGIQLGPDDYQQLMARQPQLGANPFREAPGAPKAQLPQVMNQARQAAENIQQGFQRLGAKPLPDQAVFNPTLPAMPNFKHSPQMPQTPLAPNSPSAGPLAGPISPPASPASAGPVAGPVSPPASPASAGPGLPPASGAPGPSSPAPVSPVPSPVANPVQSPTSPPPNSPPPSSPSGPAPGPGAPAPGGI